MFDGFFLKIKGFLPKVHEIFGSEMPLGINTDFQTELLKKYNKLNVSTHKNFTCKIKKGKKLCTKNCTKRSLAAVISGFESTQSGCCLDSIIDDYAKDGGEELFTKMHCVRIANL